MVSNKVWYNVADAESTTEPAMLTMPLYDEDGVEIPAEDLP